MIKLLYFNGSRAAVSKTLTVAVKVDLLERDSKKSISFTNPIVNKIT